LVYLLAVSIEGISLLQLYIRAKFEQANITLCKVLITLTYAVQITVAYGLMLLVMTFNGVLFLVIVVGITSGYAFWEEGPAQRLLDMEVPMIRI
jgi:hypothetical protein